MKRRVWVGGRERSFECRQEGETWRFHFESEEERTASVVETAGVWSVLCGGRSYEARVEAGSVWIGGRRIRVEVHDPRRWDGRRARHVAGRENVVAPIPGKVVRVLVSVGDEVEAGQGLMVVEAMKMQNEMKAAHAGRVAALPFDAGATVNAGDVLAVIE